MDRSNSTIPLAQHLKLYLVADPDQTPRGVPADVKAAISGGVTCVQLRAKRLTDNAFLQLALDLQSLCAGANVLFIVNDRVDIALAAGAAGVHLGVDDLPSAAARALGGPSFVIGYSPETDEQARAAAAMGADYLGVGPVFGTGSKVDAGTAIGTVVLARRAALAAIPVVGIGGIDAGNCGEVIDAGAAGVAVVGAILRSASPARSARTLRTAIDRALEARWIPAPSPV